MSEDIFQITQNIAILFIGYSLFVTFQMIVTGFSQDYYRSNNFERIMGIILLLALSGLQLFHFVFLQYDLSFIYQFPYYVLLFSIAPAFYLFSKPVLFAENQHRLGRSLLHFLPVLLNPLIPDVFTMPIAFAIGSLYLVWLGRSVYALRSQRSRFKLELWILGIVFMIAVAVSLFGLGIFTLPEHWFIVLYSIAIGSALLLVNIVMTKNPQLSMEIAEAARETYLVSTLSQVNCDEKLERLNMLMVKNQIYQNPELDLSMLSNELSLSNHQLSELINIHLGKSFSRYIREYRINEAKNLLVSKPSMSVLSISLSVGFTSQSNFYTAFREIVGMSPGKFRKFNRSK